MIGFRKKEKVKEILGEEKDLSNPQDIQSCVNEINERLEDLSEKDSFFSFSSGNEDEIDDLKRIRKELTSEYNKNQLQRVRKALDRDSLSYWKYVLKKRGTKEDSFAIPRNIITKILRKLFNLKFSENFEELNLQGENPKLKIDKDFLMNSLEERYGQKIESIEHNEEKTKVKFQIETP